MRIAPIKGKNFILRVFTMSDAPSIAKYMNNKKIIRFMGAMPYPYRPRDARAYITRTRMEERKKHPQKINFAIVVDGIAVGSIGLNMRDSYKAEIGYWLGEPYWGRGIITAAVRLVTAFAFRHLDLWRVYARTFHANKASSRVLEKVGYRYEGLLRKDFKKGDKLMDCRLYAIVR